MNGHRKTNHDASKMSDWLIPLYTGSDVTKDLAQELKVEGFEF